MRRVKTLEQLQATPGIIATASGGAYRTSSSPKEVLHSTWFGREVFGEPEKGWKEWMFVSKESEFDKLYHRLL